MHTVEISYTAHALARMSERGVTRQQVETVLQSPLRVLPAEANRTEVQGMIDRTGTSMLLRVIVESGAVVTVVTVITTSKISKTGASP